MTMCIALRLFLLHAKFYAYWCRHDKVTASDTVGRFLRHSVYSRDSRKRPLDILGKQLLHYVS